MLQTYEPVLSWNNASAHLLIPQGQDALKQALLELQP